MILISLILNLLVGTSSSNLAVTTSNSSTNTSIEVQTPAPQACSDYIITEDANI